MYRIATYVFLFLIIAVFSFPVQAQETIYWDVVQDIRDEGIRNSQVMNIASYMTDVYGPRLANSTSYKASAEWAKKRFESDGLSNAIVEPYGEFGVSWNVEFISVHMLSPQYMPVIAYPNTWSRGTNGEIRGKAVYINAERIASASELSQYKGKLRNAIVFIEPIQTLSPAWDPLAVRYSKKELENLSRTNITAQMPREFEQDRVSGVLPKSEVIDFIFYEGAAAVAAPDGRENYGTVLVNEVPGRAWENLDTIHPPYLVLAAEHYNRIVRILDKGIEVELLADVRISITEDRMDHNVLAELPGRDLADEIVMVGGHLDANSAGQGATDNASGAAVVMEAMRILKAIGVTPRRTIRAALWGGEEYGLLGSEKYVEANFGGVGNIPVKPDHKKLAVYINRDGGGGRIRGIHMQGNDQLRAILSDWLSPLRDLGASHLTSQISENSDHASYNDAGLIGLSFVQDPIERRSYHTNMDTYDRFIPEDLVQSSVVMAILAYHAAMRDEMLPRK